MAQKPYKINIEYIQKYYSYGSEAKVVEFKPVYKEAKPKAAKPPKDPVTTICIDPIAFCGLMLAVAMLVVMIAGVIQFNILCEDHAIMENHLRGLQEQNVLLTHAFNAGYDIETVEETALALGMVPIDQVQTISLNVTVPEREPEPTLWDNIVWFLSGLFE